MLRQHPEGLGSRELTQLLGASPYTVGNCLRYLWEEGLVEREVERVRRRKGWGRYRYTAIDLLGGG